MKNKKLIFEGAGWSSADHNGVGNCRIRSTFKNKKKELVYLEMTGHASHKNSPTSMRLYDFPWHISHLHKIKDQDSHYTKEYKDFISITMEYTKENILRFVNECLNCNFSEVEVLDEWNGFAVDGKRE